jgi:hypothetical protein
LATASRLWWKKSITWVDSIYPAADTSLLRRWLKLKPWAEAVLKVQVAAVASAATAQNVAIVETAETADLVVMKAEAAMVAHAITKSLLWKPKPRQLLKLMWKTLWLKSPKFVVSAPELSAPHAHATKPAKTKWLPLVKSRKSANVLAAKAVDLAETMATSHVLAPIAQSAIAAKLPHGTADLLHPVTDLSHEIADAMIAPHLVKIDHVKIASAMIDPLAANATIDQQGTTDHAKIVQLEIETIVQHVTTDQHLATAMTVSATTVHETIAQEMIVPHRATATTDQHLATATVHLHPDVISMSPVAPSSATSATAAWSVSNVATEAIEPRHVVDLRLATTAVATIVDLHGTATTASPEMIAMIADLHGIALQSQTVAEWPSVQHPAEIST